MTAALHTLREKWWRTRDVLLVLSVSDLRTRYGRGGMRAIKWFLDPFAALGVYLVLIALVLRKGSDATGLILVCAIVPFQLVMVGTITSMQSVLRRGSIVLNMSFPRILIPFSAIVTESIAFSASLVMLPIMMAVYGVAPTPAALWLIVAIFVTVVLAASIAYPSALFGLWYPELVPFASSVMRTLFFLAPGLIALSQITGTAREVMPYNPLTGLFELYRAALLYGHSPPAWEVLYPLATGVVIFALTVPLYRREQASFAKQIG